MTATPTASPTRRLVAAQLLGSVGDGGFYVTAALFFTRVLGLPAVQVGLGLTVAWGIGALATAPLGRVADRCGARDTATALAMATAAATAAFPLVASFPAFLLVGTTYAVAQSGLGAVRQALLAGLVPAGGRVAARARMQSAGNGGIAAGAALGGLALLADRPPAYVAVFLLDAAGFLVVALLLRRLPRTQPAPAPGPSGVLRNRPFLAAAALNAVLMLYMPMLSVVLPLWIAERTAAPPVLAAVVFVVNTVGVVLGQARAARAVTDLAAAHRAVRRGAVGLLGACLVLALAGLPGSPALAALVLVGGAGVQVVAEDLLAAGGWYLGFALAPDGEQGAYQGVYGVGVPVARAAGPLLLTGAVLGAGGVGWAGLGVAFLVAGLATAPVTRRAAAAAQRPPVYPRRLPRAPSP